jgi:hypothetical protein
MECEMKMQRFRNVFFAVGTLVVLAALLWTDPDGGVSTGLWLMRLASGVLAVTFAHYARKALHDYGEADARDLFRIAKASPTGAGLALVALSIVTLGLLMLFSGMARAQDVATVIPAAAQQHRATLASELRTQWPDHPRPEVVAALIEHESCITLRHARCWSATSRLKSEREEGAGLGQITRAYKADGSLRFDALAELRSRHPALSGLSWANVYSRPDLQIRALVLMSRDNYQALRMIAMAEPRLAFADAAYNGGLGGVQKERRACYLKAGCDPQQWFGHVELHCLKGRTALYGQRSACDINRHHVRDVLVTRAWKYRGWV